MDLLVGLVLLVLMLALVGFLVNLIVTKVPMSDTFKQLIVVAVVIFAVLFILAMLTGNVALPSLPRLGGRG